MGTGEQGRAPPGPVPLECWSPNLLWGCPLPWGQTFPSLEATLHLQGRGFWGQTEWRPLFMSQSLNKHHGPQIPGEGGNAEDRA